MLRNFLVPHWYEPYTVLKLKLFISTFQEKVWKVNMYCQFSRWWQLKMAAVFLRSFILYFPRLFLLFRHHILGLWVVMESGYCTVTKIYLRVRGSILGWWVRYNDTTKQSFSTVIFQTGSNTRYFYLQYFGGNRLWKLPFTF